MTENPFVEEVDILVVTGVALHDNMILWWSISSLSPYKNLLHRVNGRGGVSQLLIKSRNFGIGGGNLCKKCDVQGGGGSRKCDSSVTGGGGSKIPLFLGGVVYGWPLRNFFWAPVAAQKKILPPLVRHRPFFILCFNKKKFFDFANSDSVNYLPTKCKNKQPFPIKNIKNVVSMQAGCHTAFTKEWERYTLMINIILIYRD